MSDEQLIQLEHKIALCKSVIDGHKAAISELDVNDWRYSMEKRHLNMMIDTAKRNLKKYEKQLKLMEIAQS